MTNVAKQAMRHARSRAGRWVVASALVLALPGAAAAQRAGEQGSRAAVLDAEAAEKAARLQPYTLNKGRFEGETFDPAAWKPRVATAAILRARADDCFWAARRVMAFSDDLIRAIVKTGHYSDPKAEQLLADVLIQRRDKIGHAYLPAINPLVNFALDANGRVTFENAAVDADVAKVPAGGYTVRWARFDNATGEVAPIGSPTPSTPRTLSASASRTSAAAAAATTGEQAQPSEPLPAAIGSFVKLQVSAVDASRASWAVPVDVYFRRTADGWKLVGLERLP